jgi:poly-gamma-glutamate synthesis protein (capsule biosynthesis protein)
MRDLPEGFLAGVKLSAAVQQTDDTSRYDLLLGITVGRPTSGEVASSTWVYALVAPFPTVQDEVSLADLKKIWKGEASPALARRLLVSESTLNVFQHFWGQASRDAVQVVGKTALLETAWKDVPPLRKPTPTVPGRKTPTPAPPSPPVLAIIPFEEIEPRWKVLRVDGQSPLEPGFDLGSYALGVFINLEVGQEGAPDKTDLRVLEGSVELPTNYDPARITTLVMTGTTAIARHIGERMEEKGLTYPGEGIRDWLITANLTHISNEVSFYSECPKPGPLRADMRFCSSPKYIALLEYVGADIIELTGNHNLDWGYQPFLDSLAMYQDHGWKTYGGGADLEKAKQPLLVEHNGNRLAFLGCSPSGPAAVWATQYTPGSAPCDLNKLGQQVRDLRAGGYLPIVTFQAAETDTYQPAPAQGAPDFRRMARAGAVVVSGSQSHVPQTMTLVDDGEFPGASFVHYGLGNLFFDQMKPPESREEFIDRHVFYDGRYLGTQLLTALLEDYSRPRPMSDQERRDFLQELFALSNWKDK